MYVFSALYVQMATCTRMFYLLSYLCILSNCFSRNDAVLELNQIPLQSLKKSFTCLFMWVGRVSIPRYPTIRISQVSKLEKISHHSSFHHTGTLNFSAGILRTTLAAEVKSRCTLHAHCAITTIDCVARVCDVMRRNFTLKRVQNHHMFITCSFTSWQTLFQPDLKVITLSRLSRNFTLHKTRAKQRDTRRGEDCKTVRYAKLVIRPRVNLNLLEHQRAQYFRRAHAPGLVGSPFGNSCHLISKRGFVTIFRAILHHLSDATMFTIDTPLVTPHPWFSSLRINNL